MKPLGKRTYFALTLFWTPFVIPVMMVVIPFALPIYLIVNRDKIYAKYLMKGLKKNYDKFAEDMEKLMAEIREREELKKRLEKKWKGNPHAN